MRRSGTQRSARAGGSSAWPSAALRRAARLSPHPSSGSAQEAAQEPMKRPKKKGGRCGIPLQPKPRDGPCPLFGCSGVAAAHRHVNASVALGRELNGALDHGEDRVVAADADAGARVPLGAALAHQEVAGDDVLAAVALHAEALGVRVAAVLRRAARFLLCHGSSSLKWPAAIY